MRVCFYTLGCKVNLNETGALEQMFRSNGFTIVQEGEPADVFVVNSCTVTNFGDQKSRKWLRRAKGQRKQPEAQDPRAQQCQISPFHSGPLPARSRLLQCMRQTARKCPVVKSRFCALERAAGQNPLLHCGAALLYNE